MSDKPYRSVRQPLKTEIFMLICMSTESIHNDRLSSVGSSALGREDAFDDILDFLCVLGLVGFHDLLGDIVCGSGNHFAFCHVGINPPMGCPERARTISTNLAFTQTIIHSRWLPTLDMDLVMLYMGRSSL